MGTLLFLLAKLLGRWHSTHYDTALLSVLVALDGNTWLRYAIWRSMRR